MASRIVALKLLPVQLGIMRIGVGWRFLLCTVVMTAYMVVSRNIYGIENLTFAEIELLRTPFRLVAALLFWLLMADIIFARRPDIQALLSSSFAAGLILACMMPLLVAVEPLPRSEAIVVALASLPVALNEEFFFRGILQTLLVRKLGARQGIGLSTVLFLLFHIGVSPQDAISFLLVGLAGLIAGLVYFRTRSMAVVVVFHSAYDALAVVLEAPVLSRTWGIGFLLCAAVLMLVWARTRPG
jgi:membrane protease YdiL (CAAX protease family)